jgi:hypothetical protein
MINQVASHSKGKWSKDLDPKMDSESSLLLCFYDRQTDWSNQLREIKSKFPKSVIVGCSGAGSIFGTRVVDSSFVVSVTRFDHSRLKIVTDRCNSSDDSYTAGQSLGKKLLDPELRSVLVLSVGLGVNGTLLSRGLTEVISTQSDKYGSVVVSGGLAGDGPRFETTTTLANGEFSSNQVVAVGIYGSKVVVSTGSFGGWDPFGPERRVTKSKGNVLYEIDGQPALDLYKTYLGDQASQLPASALLFPLTITTDQRRGVVRTILAVDEASSSLTFAGDIPENAIVQLMKANISKLVSGASSAGDLATEGMRSGVATPMLAIAISCVGRRLVLGERIEDETESLQDVLPSGTEIVGFYSYGELSPQGANTCELHNQTMTVTLIQETA